jgi:hypothetical protein
MHLGGSPEYQFATVSSKEKMRHLAKMASSPLAKAMVAS